METAQTIEALNATLAEKGKRLESAMKTIFAKIPHPTDEEERRHVGFAVGKRTFSLTDGESGTALKEGKPYFQLVISTGDTNLKLYVEGSGTTVVETDSQSYKVPTDKSDSKVLDVESLEAIDHTLESILTDLEGWIAANPKIPVNDATTEIGQAEKRQLLGVLQNI